MPLLQEFVLWFAKFVGVSVTLLVAVYLYTRRQRLQAERQAREQERQTGPRAMQAPRRPES